MNKKSGQSKAAADKPIVGRLLGFMSVIVTRHYREVRLTEGGRFIVETGNTFVEPQDLIEFLPSVKTG